MITTSAEITGIEFLKRLRHRWQIGLAVFAGAFACTAIVVLLLPNRYESTLKVVVKNDRVDPLVGSNKQTQGILYVNDVSEPRINTEIQLLTSSDVLRRVVEVCHLGDLERKRGQSQGHRAEMALRRLQRGLTVEPVRNANVIKVSYDSTNAQRSADVVSAVWAAYNAASREMHGVPGSMNFFEKLSSQYDAELAEAQVRLEDFRKAHHVVSLPEEQTLALGNVSHLQSQMADSAAAEQRSAAAARRLRSEMQEMPVSTERNRRSMPNQALTQQLTSSLVLLENKRTEAAQRYQPTDRIMRELDTEIARTQAALNQAEKSVADEVSVSANPAMDVARSEYLRLVAESAGARAQTTQLDRQVRRDQASLAALAAESAEYKQLVQKVTAVEELDETYRRKTEESRLEQMLDEQRISNLAVVEKPFVAQLPSAPKRGLLLTLGLFWSALLALVVAGITEVATGVIRSPLGLEASTGMPLLARMPTAALPGAAAVGNHDFTELFAAMKRGGVPFPEEAE